jgi:hypothetical protein
VHPDFPANIATLLNFCRNEGRELHVMQPVLEHTRIATIGIYLTPGQDELREAIERAGVSLHIMDAAYQECSTPLLQSP